MDYNNQAIWITGASSGIGEALALDLNARGARLILSGRNVAALESLAKRCNEALILPFEATDRDALGPAVEQAEEWSGGVDMLINNAGITQRSLAKDTSISVYERIVDIDLLAPIALTQTILPYFIRRQRGHLTFISSVAGKVGVPMRTAYCAAKSGLIGYADALRAELSVEGISVHCIAPGSIATDVSRNALSGDGSVRGVSDKVVDDGIPPDQAAKEMLDKIAEGQREIIIGEGVEKDIGETLRTPDTLFDMIAGLMADGYADKYDHGKDENTE